jgi:hypothetical protein
VTRSERFLVFSTALAVPLALALETAIRALIAPPEFVELRALLRDLLTPIAWGVAGLAVVTSAFGWLLAARLYRRVDVRLPEHANAEQRRRARMGVFLLVASVPQIPALLATFLFSFGAAITPVLVAAAVSSAGVAAQARRIGSAHASETSA